MLPAGYLVKLFLKALIRFDMRLAHFIQHVVDTMLGGNLELPADVVLHQLQEEVPVLVLEQP